MFKTRSLWGREIPDRINLVPRVSLPELGGGGWAETETLGTRLRSNWNLEVLAFVEGGKPENPEKNPRDKDENQQQTQPTYDAGSWI